MSDRTSTSPATIIVGIGASTATAVHEMLRRVSLADALAGAGPIEILTGPGASRLGVRTAVANLKLALVDQLPHEQIVVRRSPAFPLRAAGAWTDVPTPPGATRFEAVRVPAWWRRSDRRCLVSEAPRLASSPAYRPLASVAAFAHPRQRLAARLSRDRAALAAELASPWRPRFVLLVGTWRASRVAIATDDLIVAELSWLALAEPEQGALGVGPWEDPAVQRATALGFGAAGPHQLRLLSGAGPAEVSLREYFGRRLGVVEARLLPGQPERSPFF